MSLLSTTHRDRSGVSCARRHRRMRRVDVLRKGTRVRRLLLEALEDRRLLANLPPIADAGGPYFVAPAAEYLRLDGSQSHDPDEPLDQIVQYDWDLTADGSAEFFGAIVFVQMGQLQTLGLTPNTNLAVQLQVKDSHGALSYPTTTTISIDNAPIDIVLSPATLTEIQPAGTLVGALTTSDLDAGDRFTYAMVPGQGDVDNASFVVDGDKLRSNAVFDYERKDSYSVRVRSTDAGGLWVEKEFAIAVTNLLDSGDIEWLDQFGGDVSPPGDDVVLDSAVDAEGNIYVAGKTNNAFLGETNWGGYDAFIRKCDASGNEIWTRQFGTTGEDVANSVAVAADGSAVYVVGYTNGVFPNQANAGGQDAFVRMYDANATEIWTRQFGTATTDAAYRASVDGADLYVMGHTDGMLGTSHFGGYDVFLRKYDAAGGNTAWIQQYGSTSSDRPFALDVWRNDSNPTGDNYQGIYVAGRTDGALGGPFQGGADAFLLKLGFDGAVNDSQQLGTGATDVAAGVTVDSTGIYVAGHTRGILVAGNPGGNYDLFLRRYNDNLDELEGWVTQFGTPVDDYVTQLSGGASGLYVTGYTLGTLAGQLNAGGQDAFVWKCNADGTEASKSQFGSSANDIAYGVSVTASEVIVTGSTAGALTGQMTLGGNDGFQRKYDTGLAGAIWTRQFGTGEAGNDVVQAVDANGYLYVAGKVDRALPGQLHVGEYDAFVSKYDPNGDPIWTRQFGTASNDSAYAVSIVVEGINTYVYVAGSTGGNLQGASAGGVDAFLRKYDLDGNEVWTQQLGTSGNEEANGLDVFFDAITGKSNVYLVGYTTGNFPGEPDLVEIDCFISKYDDVGSVVTHQWTRQFGSENSGDYAYSVVADASGAWVAGRVRGSIDGALYSGNGDAFVRKYETDGMVAWTDEFGAGVSASDYASRLVLYDNYCYLLGRTSGSLDGNIHAGGWDYFVRRYDRMDPSPAGTVPTFITRQFGTSGDDHGFGMAVDASGIYVTGYTTGFFPGFANVGSADTFTRKHDLNLTVPSVLWTDQFGTNGDDVGNWVSAAGSSVYVGGYTTGTLVSPTWGGQDAFLRKYTSVGTVEWTRTVRIR